MKTKNPINIKRGKKSKIHGMAFELRTRKDLEEKGWITSKWQNNVKFEDYTIEDITLLPDGLTTADHVKYGIFTARTMPEEIVKGKLIPAKPKMVFNPIIKRMVPQQISSGFPDFVCFRKRGMASFGRFYEVIGVESKLTGTLDKEEKEKCRWLLDNGVFSRILISKKTKVKNKIVVEYIDFVDIEKRMKHSKKQSETKSQSKSQSEENGR